MASPLAILPSPIVRGVSSPRVATERRNGGQRFALTPIAGRQLLASTVSQVRRCGVT